MFYCYLIRGVTKKNEKKKKLTLMKATVSQFMGAHRGGGKRGSCPNLKICIALDILYFFLPFELSRYF